MITPKKSFNVQEYELRQECLKRSLDIFEEIRKFILDSPIIDLIAPSSIEEIIIRNQGKPKWGDVRTADGWKEFFLYAKLLDERYSVFPHTMFETSRTNLYYIDNIISLRENSGAPKITLKKIQMMDNFSIMESFMSIEDIAIPTRRALNFCFPTELIGLSANSSEHHKALEEELRKQDVKDLANNTADVSQAVDDGEIFMTLEELTDIMNNEF